MIEGISDGDRSVRCRRCSAETSEIGVWYWADDPHVVALAPPRPRQTRARHSAARTRNCQAHRLPVFFDMHHVGAFQDVEGLRSVSVNMQRRTESGWLPLGLEDCERSRRCGSIGKDDSFEIPEGQIPQASASPPLHDRVQRSSAAPRAIRGRVGRFRFEAAARG